jgi:hypothetical protein
LIVVILAALARVTPTYAGPSEAQQRFDEGRALVNAGRPADAIPKFLASIAIEPTTSALINLADAYERIGKIASAYHRFREVERLTRETDSLRSEEARKRADALSQRLPKVLLRGGADVERVLIDGAVVDRATWGEPLTYDPGPHALVLERKDGVRVDRVIELAPAMQTDVVLDSVVPSSAPIAATPVPPPHQGRSAARTVGIVIAGVGGASLVTGGVLGVLALGAASDLKAACATYPSCPPERRGELVALDDDAHTFGNLSTITLVAGAALVGLGTVLYLTRTPGGRAAAARPLVFEW